MSLKFRSLELSFPAGVELSANSEMEFTAIAKKNLLGLITWSLTDQKQLLDHFKSLLGSGTEVPMTGANAILFKGLRSEIRSNELQMTAYKYVYASALLSPRTPRELFAFIKSFRELFKIDQWEACLIQDGVLSELDLFLSNSFELIEKDKVGIVALCCLLLRLDNATHILETEMLRSITASLRCGAIAPASLMAEMGKPPVQIFSKLEEASKQWAILFLMRMGCSDGAMRPKEMEFIASLSADLGMDAQTILFVQKVLFIETGLQLPEVG